MADRPILFSSPMVRALLAGRKTQTRRLFKPRAFEFYTHPVSGDRYNEYRPYRDGTWDESRISGSGPMRSFGWGESLYAYLPHAPGDQLWVREAWRTLQKWDDLKPSHLADDASKITFEADPENRNKLWAFGKLRPSMFMPRWASRLTLTVTDVRVERLQDISEADAVAEGVEPDRHGWKSYGDLIPEGDVWATAKLSYEDLWETINGLDSWDANPWIYAVSFRCLQKNIDLLTGDE